MQANLFINENNYLLNYSLSPENNIIVESILDETGADQKSRLPYQQALALLQTEIHNNPPTTKDTHTNIFLYPLHRRAI